MTTTQATKIVRPLDSGQMTVPADFRKGLGTEEHTLLLMTLRDGALRITRVQTDTSSKGSPGLRALYEYFAPVREEILARGISQEELFADIDAAVAAVRAKKRAKRA